MKRIIVIMMDIDMPGESDIKGVSPAKESRPETPVIMSTVFETDEKLFKALKEVMEGAAPMSPSITRKVLNSLQTPKAFNRYELTEREIEVLRLLTDGSSSKIIATKMNIAFETVRSHLKNIYHKLQVTCGKEAIAKALKERILQ